MTWVGHGRTQIERVTPKHNENYFLDIFLGRIVGIQIAKQKLVWILRTRTAILDVFTDSWDPIVALW